MDTKKNWSQLLNLLDRPAFLVRDGKIIQQNACAHAKLLSVGLEITPLIVTGLPEYQTMGEDCLCLTLRIDQEDCNACVHRTEEGDLLFLLDEQADMNALRLLALAAQQLRGPLGDAMSAVEQVLPAIRPESIPTRRQAADMSRGLYQLLRIVGNMADAQQFLSGTSVRWERTELNDFFSEITEKAETLAAFGLEICITFKGTSHPVVTCVDREKLERACYNLLSNALRFTPKGGTIELSLTTRGKQAVLRVRDSGEGLSLAVRDTLFGRYRRNSTIEDGRFGMGLGLLIVRQTAAIHGGALLIGPAPEGGTQAALSLTLHTEPPAGFRSPILSVDYTGELDHALVELSRELPRAAFESLNLY